MEDKKETPLRRQRKVTPGELMDECSGNTSA